MDTIGDYAFAGCNLDYDSLAFEFPGTIQIVDFSFHRHKADWVTVKPATSDENGLERLSCECGDFYRIIPLLESDSTGTENNDINNTNPGNTDNPDNIDTPEKPDFSGFKIKGYVPSLSVDYKSTVIFHTTIEAPEGYEIVWSNNVKGSECKLNSATEKEYKVSAKMVNKATGEIAASTDEVTVNVNVSFFAKIIAFFRGLFGSLPTYEDFKKI